MPLQLGGVETARRQIVLWNPEAPEEHKDSKERIEKLISQGFILKNETDGEVVLDPPNRDADIGCFRILSQNGDDRVIWDRREKNQVKEAFNKFKELMKKGYTAYATRNDGSRGHRITEFDPGLEEIILGAIGIGGKRGPAGEAVLVPKTVPG